MEYRGETLDRATAAELADTHVMDGQRRRYVTVLPPYCSSTEDYVRVLAWRIVLCMLTLPVLVLSVVAQVVPYIHQECSWYVHVCFRSGGCPGSDGGYYYYLVTQESSTTMYSIGLFPLCIVACVFALVLLALTITFAALWMWDESRRRAEAAMNRRVLRLYGRARADGCVDELSNLPYANKCVTNAGLVRHVPLEAREVARAKRDRDVGISIFSLYLVYLALDLSVVCIMFIIPRDSEVGYWCVYESKKYTTGTILSVIALGLGVLSVVLVAVPQAANLSLCCPRRVTRCLLMIAHEEDEAIADTAALAAARLLLERHHAAQAQQHHGAARSWPVQNGSHDNSGIPVAHPLSPHLGGDGGASEMASVPAKEKNLAFQYNVYVGDSP
ncbi:hypothetical protein NESM_000540000 [Novymonas esmeraldas]|uniref:Uncharacterized protein n=1 Tax=Novymonas esmeraldas TaxID=1808958 RepID=A0AAW0EQQ1_9TRYP